MLKEQQQKWKTTAKMTSMYSELTGRSIEKIPIFKRFKENLITRQGTSCKIAKRSKGEEMK